MEEKNINEKELVINEHPDYKTEVLSTVRSGLTPGIMKDRILDYHENDIALAMDQMSREERRKLYSLLDNSSLAKILEYSENINEYIGELPLKKRISVLSEIEASMAADYLNQVEKETKEALTDLMDRDVADEIKLFDSFDDDEIGSRMTTNYISVKVGSNIKETMKALIKQAAENDNISTIYMVDGSDTLVGAIDLKDLITARADADIDSIMRTSYPYVYSNELIEDCIERIKDYSEDSIPVLDRNNKLTGVLIPQDITELVDDMLGEDYAKLAGLTAEEDLNEPTRKSIAKRLPWLIVLLGLGLIVSSVVGAFEHVVAHLTLIVCFQSLILDMAGNVGTQSLAVTIRVLTDEKLGIKQKLKLIFKETRIGLIHGVLLGIISFLFIGIYIVIFKSQPIGYAFSISLCTGVALLIAIIISSTTGTVIPLILKKLKIDPAVASGPLITTINDLSAVTVYYGLAWFFLIGIMHY